MKQYSAPERYLWLDGKVPKYSNWWSQANGNCVVMDSNYNWTWTPIDCTTHNFALCEKPAQCKCCQMLHIKIEVYLFISGFILYIMHIPQCDQGAGK